MGRLGYHVMNGFSVRVELFVGWNPIPAAVRSLSSSDEPMKFN
jgi:hypothetical protein